MPRLVYLAEGSLVVWVAASPRRTRVDLSNPSKEKFTKRFVARLGRALRGKAAYAIRPTLWILGAYLGWATLVEGARWTCNR